MRKRSPILGLALAAVAAAVVFALPQSVLDGAATAAGAGAIAPQAAPPLGMTARVLLALIAFGVVFLTVLLVSRRQRPPVDEPIVADDVPERDFFADTTPYSLDPPSTAAPAAASPSQPVAEIPSAPTAAEPSTGPALVEAPAAEVVKTPAQQPAEVGELRDAIGRIAADVAAMRAQQAVDADDLGGTLRTIQLTEALRSVESLLREQKGSTVSPAEQLQRLEARLDSIAAKIDALSAGPGPAAPADPATARRVSSALAELRQTLAR